ncbi:MAG: M24 family metallopeptidase [Gemmataceae bacterium]
MDYPARRRQRLARCFKEESLDVLLISNPVNVTYLTGFSGESSYLLLHRRHAILVSDGRFTEQIQEECPGLEAHIRPPTQTLPQATAEVLNQLSSRGVGFESGHLSVAEWEALRQLAPTYDWKGARDRVEKLRAVKDPSEIEQIREAIRMAERAFAMFRVMLRSDDDEKTLSDALELYIRRAGGKCGSFPSIVAVGERAALPHAPPTCKRVHESPLLLVDWGASGPFYKSDLTRVLRTHTTSLPTRTTQSKRWEAKLESIHVVVLAAQQQAIQAVRPGVKAADVDAVARGVIAEAGWGEHFTHGLGHGLGLQVHEAPAVRANSTDVLQAGMVVTIEPGIYLPGWGGVRIEDDVLVTEEGAEVLSQVPRDFAAAMIEL